MTPVQLTDAGYGSHVLELRLFRITLSTAFILKARQEFEQNILGDLTPSSFQVGELSETESRFQIVGCRVKGPSHGHFPSFQ
jgi:hypothetical protein